MTTAIKDFAEKYSRSGVSRLHMPGHKGAPMHGLEPLDLTEIKGADFLYDPDGIILSSELKTSAAYGSAMTAYSAEGSSLSIKAALSIIWQYLGKNITVAAPRNCHRAFLNGCALLDVDVKWIYPSEPSDMLCRCSVTAEAVERTLKNGKVDAVYITSPDYLGSIADIAGISEVCRKHGAFLICDNAHGAYLKFLTESLHPLDLGADIVCDSAHKTLPVYTGGAYLHISKKAPKEFCALAKPAMALFGSTSPSYLIMESLDICAGLLGTSLPGDIRKCCEKVGKIKELMKSRGIPDLASEPMKITAAAEKIGYGGEELAKLMRQARIECEYADPAAVVLMFSPYNTQTDFDRVTDFFSRLPIKAQLRYSEPPLPTEAKQYMSIRQAMFSPSEKIPSQQAEGRICASCAMSCQPSVAVVMAGEMITSETVRLLERYGIDQVDVIRQE